MFWVVKDLQIGDAGDAIHVVDALSLEEWRERVQEAMNGEYGKDWVMRLAFDEVRELREEHGVEVPDEVYDRGMVVSPSAQPKIGDTVAVFSARQYLIVKVLPRDFLADILDEATFDTSVKVLFGVSPDDALAPFAKAKDVMPSMEVGVHVRGNALTIERAGDEGACTICGRRTHWWFDNSPVCSFKCLKTVVFGFGGESDGSRN